MNGAEVIAQVLERSGISKSALCAEAGMSRSLLDSYLKGRSQPSVAQVDRIARAAGLEIGFRLDPKPAPLPEQFVAVLEFGELFPRAAPRPLVNLGPVWRQAVLRGADG